MAEELPTSQAVMEGEGDESDTEENGEELVAAACVDTITGLLTAIAPQQQGPGPGVPHAQQQQLPASTPDDASRFRELLQLQWGVLTSRRRQRWLRGGSRA